MTGIDFFESLDPSICGGKGKNLVVLTKAKFPVPLGFIITTSVFDLFHRESVFPMQVQERIHELYLHLTRTTRSPFVSVRSSASAEDLKHASFAGQYDTFLYVHSFDQLITRIIDCRDSLYNERAVAYRKRFNIPEDNIKMAVVVQSMIDPRSAGIMFTSYRQPGKETENVMLIESNWGCGETVVSGKATPDHFILSKNSPHSVIETLRGDKETIMKGSPDGFIEFEPTEEQRSSLSLEPVELQQLCELGNRIEGHFGFPCDIEWAIDEEGTIFILQSRPITK